jgi:pantetheine-phosphate adenylyltransferase
MKKIGFSGTLDPITNGHMWVIEEARTMADKVVVFISENPFKKCQFSAERRQQIVEQSCVERGWDNVSVIVVRGDYTARAAKKHGVDYLLRGIRNTTDFDYENLLQQANVDVINGTKTVFVMPPRDLGSVSSSFIKGLQGPAGWHWYTKKFIPPAAYKAWIEDWLYQEWRQLWSSKDVNSHIDATSFANQEAWFQKILQAYREPTRHYHNLDHLVHGLSELRVWAANCAASENDLRVLKQAFWFHDFVYAGQQDVSDEEASAQAWLNSSLDLHNAEAVAALIRATDHFQEQHIDHPLKPILLGADLAILGQHADIYIAYASAIRQEYQHVPSIIYSEKRRHALVHLRKKALDQQLFQSAYFGHEYNANAIENMTQEIERLTLANASQN